MKSTLTVPRLAAVLKKVPEKKFRISELAPRLLDANGRVDIEECMKQQGEISLAVTEVKSYVHAVGEARYALENLGRRNPYRIYEEENIEAAEDEE